MFAIMYSGAKAMEYLLGGSDNVLCDKLAQVRRLDRMTDNPMEGTIATCRVEGNIIHKELRNPERVVKIANSMNIGANFVGTFGSVKGQEGLNQIANRLLEEIDLVREANIQRLFYKAYQNHAIYKIPQVYESSANIISMEYVPWKRLCDIEEGKRKTEAIHNTTLFFFDALDNHQLVHGDLSVTNILVSETDNRICLIDYGSSVFLTEEESKDLVEMVNNPKNEKVKLLANATKSLRENPPVMTKENYDQQIKLMTSYAFMSFKTLDMDNSVSPYTTLIIKSMINLSKLLL